MQPTNDKLPHFSWYSGSTNANQPTSTINQPTAAVNHPTNDGQLSIPITQSNSQSAPIPLDVQKLNIPTESGQNIVINAQNVYIDKDGGISTSNTTNHPQQTVSKTTTESKDGDHKEKKEQTTVSNNTANSTGSHPPTQTTTASKAGTANADGSHPPSTTVQSTSTVSKSEAEAAAAKTTSTSKPADDSNPLGIPTTSAKSASAAAATDASKDAANKDAPLVGPKKADGTSTTPATTTPATTAAPLSGPLPANGAAVQPSTAPSATTTLKDGIHDTPLSTGTASDKHDTAMPLSTKTSDSSTLPNGSAHPAEVKDPKSGKTTDKDGKKKEKEHKSIKQKLHDWKENRKSGGGAHPATGDVHPKDSRDGKELPSANELSTKYMNLGGESAPESNNGLPKDKLDGTGKSVTGSDANPSKASNPAHFPDPGMKQAPIEAKSA